MYCPTCGNSIADGLKFCNSCGLRLVREEEGKDGAPEKMLSDLLRSLFFIVVFGLGILVGLVAVLLNHDVKTEVVMMVVITYLLAVFGIGFMLARQVPKLIDARLKAWNKPSNAIITPQFERGTTAQLEEYRQPASSVTDNTTRTLDEMPLKRT